MNMLQLAELSKSDDGKILDGVIGTLTKLYDQKELQIKNGSNAGKSFMIQNGELTQNHSIVKITFTGRDAFATSLRGQEIKIESQKTAKHGVQGLRAKLNSYQGRDTMELHVTGSALVTFPNAHEDAPMALNKGEEDFSPVQTPKPPQNAPKVNVAPKTANPVDETRRRLMQYANLYQLSWGAASFLAEASGWDNATAKDVATTFFIQASKEGLVVNMPSNGPISDKPPQEEAEGFHDNDQQF